MTRYFMEIEIPPDTGSGSWAKAWVEIPAATDDKLRAQWEACEQ